MTAPTPEQMRALAEWLDVFGAGSPQQAMPEELSDSADALRAAADDVVRLRAVIETAPHAESCPFNNRFRGFCTCWKADTL